MQITEEELESLEAEANNGIEFREFVPVEKIDPVYFESSYYLAPSKGAEKPYRLMAETLEKTGRVALAQIVFHEKESLVAVRSVQNGLVMHLMYFKDEVRDFEQVPKGKGEKVPKREIDLGRDLIEKLSAGEFEPEKYHDEYRERFLGDDRPKGQGRGDHSCAVGSRTRPRQGGRYLRRAETKPRAVASKREAAREPVRKTGRKRRKA